MMFLIGWQDYKHLWQDRNFYYLHFSGIKFAIMKQLIWYNPQNGIYSHGSEMDLKINESLIGTTMEVLYEMGESEISLMKKIVVQLNSARTETAIHFQRA
ncbi:MAG: hypothetical protein ACJAVY_000052 [Marinoscillum sp.]|jgi:hypothetical protein